MNETILPVDFERAGMMQLRSISLYLISQTYGISELSGLMMRSVTIW